MSLINKMLQDLEERQSGAETLGSLQGYVRATPEPRARPAFWPIAISALAAGVAAISAGIWWMNSQQVNTPVVSVPQPVTQASSLSLKLDHMPPKLPSEAADQNNVTHDLHPANGNATLDMSGVSSSSAENTQALTERIAADSVLGATAQPLKSVMSPRPEEALQPPLGMPSSAVATRAVSKPEPKRIEAEAGPALAADGSLSGRKNGALPEPGIAATEADVVSVKVSKQIKQLTPHQQAENEYRRALGLIEQSRGKEAMHALELALHLDSRHGAARQTLAALLLDARRPEDAMRSLSEGLAQDKTQAGLAMMLARLQVDRQEARMAIETLQRSLPHAAERGDYRAFLAALLQREARHREAIEHYLSALGKTPSNGVWWMGIAISLQAENRISEARDAYSRAKTSGALSPELLAFVEQKLAQLR